jgi:hypothetical protein
MASWFDITSSGGEEETAELVVARRAVAERAARSANLGREYDDRFAIADSIFLLRTHALQDLHAFDLLRLDADWTLRRNLSVRTDADGQHQPNSERDILHFSVLGMRVHPGRTRKLVI